jgi:predicted AlkP superfamily pyrophosphatase or phosphodiesterase
MARALLLLVDGARPDAIQIAGCPNILQLAQRGSYTLQASSVMPSVTLPCHMSIFHSVPPTRHGITDNNWMPMARPLPGLFDQASAAGLRCGFFYNWEPLRNIGRPNSLVASTYRSNCKELHGDHEIVDEAIRYLAADPLDFVFVYLGSVDEWGHLYGWMSDGYLAQLAHVDSAIGALLNALPADVTVLFQSDHGGHDRNHGTPAAEDMAIPWIIAGSGIRQDHAIAAPVSLLDTAPTLARVLGIAPHDEWEGRCLEEVFVAA